MQENFNEKLGNSESTNNGENTNKNKSTNKNKNSYKRKNTTNGVGKDNALELPKEVKDIAKEAIKKGGQLHQTAHEQWRKDQATKEVYAKQAFYRCTYGPACEVVMEVIGLNGRKLGIYPPSKLMDLATLNGIVLEGEAWFYTMEFCRTNYEEDPFGVRFMEQMNQQLDKYSAIVGQAVPMIYQELLGNMRVVMKKCSGNLLIAYFGLLNDPLTQNYINHRYNRH